MRLVSNINGLQVDVPADAYPAPHCDRVMCPAGAEPFYTPQLTPSVGPVMFSFVAGSDGGNPGGVGAALFDWSGPGPLYGSFPDGAPAGDGFVFNRSNLGGTSVGYEGVSDPPYTGITLTLYDNVGNVILGTVSLVEEDLMPGSWELPEFTALATPLVVGDTYIVEMVFTTGAP